jgi:adenylate cyclase
LLACSLFHQGALSRTLEQTEQGLSLYDTRYASPRTAAYGDNAGVTCHSWAALALCLLGYPERARAEVWESIAVAEAARLAPARAAALVQAALVSQCALEHEPALEWADAALAVATATGSRYRHAMATVVRGWAVAAHGDVDAGVEQIRDGIGLSRAIGARMDDPHWLGMLADALLRAGRTEEASAAIEEAIDAVAVARGFFYEAELHRLRGVLRAREGDREEAEASLAKALETAHLQQARLLELRAAVTLARLRQTEDEHLDACGRVAAVYGWFTEGFDTPDLRDAKALLESVRSPERG